MSGMIAWMLGALLAASPVTLSVEVMRAPDELRRGLQGHRPITAAEGMLFVLPEPETARFWMKDVTFAIDIVFVAADGQVVNIAAEAPPCRSLSCPVYKSAAPVTHVLELQAGWSRRHGLRPGARIVPEPAAGRVTLYPAAKP